MEKNAMFYTQKKITVEEREATLNLIDCPVGYIYVIEYEDKHHGLNHLVIEDLDKAEKMFKTLVNKMLDGKL